MLSNWSIADTNNTSVKFVAEPGPTTVKPFFQVKTKNAEGKYELWEDKFTNIKGKCLSIRTTHTWAGTKREVKWYNIVLASGDDRVFIDTTNSNAAKDMVNGLAAIRWNWIEVEVSAYLNKNWYPAVFVAKDGKRVDGLLAFPFDKDELWEKLASEVAENKEEISIEDIPF